ncbi:hypothetical protein [Nocardia huaxiensis]|nr:hypothetical protein [Nocardia huaxiensis]
MLTDTNGDASRLSFWPRVREFAVPASMIEIATARRDVGDWAGACAAAGFDVDIDLRAAAREYGPELAARVRADLRHLAPDLLRWHMPRVAPDGLLRPGLTITLARYDVGESGNPCGRESSVHLVVRTAPAWADAGQRIGLTLWDGARFASGMHPHPRPDRRYRLDLHRHLWDARRADELRIRCGAADSGGETLVDPELASMAPRERAGAVDRWAAEARILLDAEGQPGDSFLLRLGGRQRVAAQLIEDGCGPPEVRPARGHPVGGLSALPLLPDAATWVLPDLELLRSGAISPDRLHPLVASALVPDHVPGEATSARTEAYRRHLVPCQGREHRIGVVDGVLTALDHDPAEIRREELLVALTGKPVPCLQFIDWLHRNPLGLDSIRERLRHGDTAGALAVVEGLLGPDAVLREGPLLDALEASALRRITYGLYRAGLARPDRNIHPHRGRPRDRRGHPRHANSH